MSKLKPQACAHSASEPSPVRGSADVTAMQALAGGVANEGQQKQALDWILKGLRLAARGRTGRASARPTSRSAGSSSASRSSG
jgi:hypothetical protein